MKKEINKSFQSDANDKNPTQKSFQSGEKYTNSSQNGTRYKETKQIKNNNSLDNEMVKVMQPENLPKSGSTSSISSTSANSASGLKNAPSTNSATNPAQASSAPQSSNTANNSETNTSPETFEQYSKDLAKFEMEESFLLGEFDNDGNYIIEDAIKKELIEIDKIVERKTAEGYLALSQCGRVKFEFFVSVNIMQNAAGETFRIASLKVMEHYFFQTTKQRVVSSIATFQDIDSPNFLHKVKAFFHLHSKTESEGKVFNNDVKAEKTLAKFKNRFTLMEINKIKKENIEVKYINEITKILRENPEGTKVIERFQEIVKLNGLNINNSAEFLKLRFILDKVVNDSISSKTLPESTVKKVIECREKFVTELKNHQNKFAELKIPEIPIAPVKPKNSSSKNNSSSGNNSGKPSGNKGAKDAGDKKGDKEKEKPKADIFGSAENRMGNKLTQEAVQKQANGAAKQTGQSATSVNQNSAQAQQANSSQPMQTLPLPPLPSAADFMKMQDLIENNSVKGVKPGKQKEQTIIAPTGMEFSKISQLINVTTETHHMPSGIISTTSTVSASTTSQQIVETQLEK